MKRRHLVLTACLVSALSGCTAATPESTATVSSTRSTTAENHAAETIERGNSSATPVESEAEASGNTMEGLITGEWEADLVSTGMSAEAAGDTGTMDWHIERVCGESMSDGNFMGDDFSRSIGQLLRATTTEADTLRVIVGYECPERDVALERAILGSGSEKS